MAEPAPRGRPAARRGRPGHDQAAVLRCAIELFNRHGYEGTSMGDLAKELGLTKSAIYHHVPSKEHLLAAALDEALEGLEAMVDAALEATPGSSATDRLQAAVHRSVEILLEHLPAVTLLLRVRGNTELELDALRRRRRVNEQLVSLVRAAVAEGTVRDDIPPEVISQLVFGMVGSLVDWYRPGGPVNADALADELTMMALDGLRAPSQPARS